MATLAILGLFFKSCELGNLVNKEGTNRPHSRSYYLGLKVFF